VTLDQPIPHRTPPGHLPARRLRRLVALAGVDGGQGEAVFDRTTGLRTCRTEPLKGQRWGRRDFRLVDPDGYYLRITPGNAAKSEASAVPPSAMPTVSSERRYRIGVPSEWVGRRSLYSFQVPSRGP
jgi:hypothetical protein